jgi:alanine-glyoxylate transaminase/serine-glyoxylate transaminase/serine-pyruvate transaminase
MNRSNEDHRSPAFPKLSKSVIEDVKQIFGTTAATSFIFPTTGLVASFPACPFANCLSERGDQQAKAFVHQSVCLSVGSWKKKLYNLCTFFLS